MMAGALIAVDWGTTNFRASLVAAGGATLDTVANDGGMKGIAAAGGGLLFEKHLLESVGRWKAAQPELPIVCAGMVGSKQGWVNAPYLACPVGAAAVAEGLVPVPNTLGWDVWVMSGVSCKNGNGETDVMRGEEAQLLGLIERQGLTDALVCLPGSHSKWAEVKAGGVLQSFKSYMTGELFALLQKHSILKFSVDDAADESGGDGGGPPESAAFRAGVVAGHTSPVSRACARACRRRGRFAVDASGSMDDVAAVATR